MIATIMSYTFCDNPCVGDKSSDEYLKWLILLLELHGDWFKTDIIARIHLSCSYLLSAL